MIDYDEVEVERNTKLPYKWEYTEIAWIKKKQVLHAREAALKAGSPIEGQAPILSVTGVKTILELSTNECHYIGVNNLYFGEPIAHSKTQYCVACHERMHHPPPKRVLSSQYLKM